jgi:hypothetical protein
MKNRIWNLQPFWTVEMHHQMSNLWEPDLACIAGLDFGNQPSLGMQQQLLLLLRRCLQRALELKLPHLVAFSRLALAKFDLQVIEFPSPDIH